VRVVYAVLVVGRWSFFARDKQRGRGSKLEVDERQERFLATLGMTEKEEAAA